MGIHPAIAKAARNYDVSHSLGILDMRRTSIHRNGCFRGYLVEFKHSSATMEAK